jgi:hypothetical protein
MGPPRIQLACQAQVQLKRAFGNNPKMVAAAAIEEGEQRIVKVGSKK